MIRWSAQEIRKPRDRGMCDLNGSRIHLQEHQASKHRGDIGSFRKPLYPHENVQQAQEY